MENNIIYPPTFVMDSKAFMMHWSKKLPDKLSDKFPDETEEDSESRLEKGFAKESETPAFRVCEAVDEDVGIICENRRRCSGGW